MSDDRPGSFHISSDPDTTSINQPETQEAKKVPRQPLRLLLVSPLKPPETVPDWEGPSRVQRVDKNDFAGLMQTMAPRLALEVPNTISDTPKTLELNLHFASLDDFAPAQVARQIPPLKQLLEIRTLVQEVRSGSLDLETFRTRLHETSVDADWADQLYQTLSRPASTPPPAPKPTGKPAAPESGGGNDPLDRLMGMMDVAGGSDESAGEPSEKPKTSSVLGSLVKAVTADDTPTAQVEKSTADLLVDDLDQLISGQLNEVFNDAGFRRLEAAWRGLKFLVDRLNFHEDILLDVLAAPKTEADNALYHQVLIPEHNAAGEQPALSAVLLDAAFDNSTADLTLLADLADTGASLQAPIVASVAPAFFGKEKQSDLPGLPVLWQHLDTAEYIAWHKLRENKASNFLVLALPDFLLRYAYDAEEHRAKGFTFVEEGQLWGRASLAVGVRVAQSFVQTGWPTHILGTSQARVEDLPLWYSPQGHTPLGCLLPDSKFGEFKKAGFTVLAGSKDRDYLFLARANTVCKPATYDDLVAAAEAREHVTLASQLFVARAAHHVLAIQPEIPPSENPEATLREIDAQMRAFLYSSGKTVQQEAVWVEHVADSGLPDHELFAIRLTPPAHVLSPSVSLVLGMQVPRQGAE